MERTAVGELKSRALAALSEEVESLETRSLGDGAGRFWLISDSHEGSGKGTELYLEFPTSEDRTPTTLATSVELYTEGRAVFSGVWETEARIGAEVLEPVGAWENVCVDFADAYAFFERSIPLVGGRLFSRRILFAYNESLLLVVDELVPNLPERSDPAPRSLESRLTVAEDARVRREEDSREITFFDGTTSTSASKALARLFPLALPEWREDRTRGEFNFNAETGTITRSLLESSACVVSPLVVDLNSYRAARPCTWRPLTVGERMEPAPRDSAVGYKLQLGAEQYVLYVSTSVDSAIRSILSRNLLSDFMFGKFLATSGVRPIVDVEVLGE